ncbi:ammonium transporter [Nitrospirales bacterium NOB]|nr:MAG: ammonium transporter amt [Nitrospira sp. OLB3]MBV6469660.1 Ammonium transporter [Nitrospirota bacterium]MCE7965498.1 ammonium transporter [Nitrospira sp. NTP2]MCK6493474.1 ammonium transporter [Nitrospira sp.]MDL1890457.1 ammonium transporter [Nitrospirales bacterium NOB]MEB2338745.1 ammonium transporter [Nitrospirales bacterium]
MTSADHVLWLLMSTTLLLLIVPGIALFYGGMVRKKNVMNTMGLPFAVLAIVSLEWVFLGDQALFHLGNANPIGQASDGSLLWSAYRGVMASIALALVAGAIVERVRFSFFLVFGACWVLVVYLPLSHWFWGNGWLASLGVLDFSGGAVIHVSAGGSALVMAIVLGPRRGYGRIEMMPNHLPFSFCGAGLIWVGWFGFTGAAVSASMSTVAGAFVTIQLSAAAAAAAWTAVEWLQRDKPTALGSVSGAVAGLVAITPAAGYVGPLSALVIGIGAGGLCYMVVNYVKLILGYDDSLDVFGMHGVGGTWGMIATGLFASTDVNPSGSDGLFYGYPYQFAVQALAVGAAWALAGAGTWLLLRLLMSMLPSRVAQEGEVLGLDLYEHGEKGYTG